MTFGWVKKDKSNTRTCNDHSLSPHSTTQALICTKIQQQIPSSCINNIQKQSHAMSINKTNAAHNSQKFESTNVVFETYLQETFFYTTQFESTF